MYIAGSQVTSTISEANINQGKGFSLGDRVVDHDGKEYVFVQANGAITAAGYVVTIDEVYQAYMLSTANDARGDLVGVPLVAFADNDYGWVQVKGPSSVWALASAAANVRLNTTATAGALDDDATAGSMEIIGLVLTAANGGAPALTAAMLNYPSIGATL